MWQAVEIGWTKPKEAPANWNDAKIKATNFNSRALNALFSVVTNEEFKKISLTETAKEAWIILQTTYEGTKAIKDSKLLRLTTSFEEIKMEEDESFDEFYTKLKDIVNSAFNLGETKSSETDESSDDEDSKMKSYITRQFKKFMKNANGKGFDKDRRQSNSSQFKEQDKGGERC